MIIGAQDVRRSLPWPELIEALRHQFRQGCIMPVRHHHDVRVPGEANATLLLMPAWVEGEYIGMKQVNVFPGNGARDLPAIAGTYLLSCGKTGRLLAVMDGGELTARRTAAASALAAGYLARPDSKRLLVVGTGRLGGNLIEAHAANRDLEHIALWGRDAAKAERVAQTLRDRGYPVAAVEDLPAACRQADIISTATLSEQPLIRGEWLTPGTHVDLVGGFKPSMREADDEAIRRADVYVDTRDGACQEAGDIVIPLQSGVLSREGIQADLFQLCREQCKGRRSNAEITLFKSVGAALEDLAAAILVYKNRP